MNNPTIEMNQGPETPGAKTYRCGTLTYTKLGLAALFLWILWGDVVYTVMETIVPSIVPLKLEKLGASNATIGLLVTTITGVMNMVITPIASFKSDRYRSKWGRRIPFLILPTPFITLFLVLLAYAQEIGQWVHSLGGEGFSQAGVTIWVIGILLMFFQFFNMFVASVYWYLFNDVVPPQYLGRFMALFRTVGLLVSGLYSMLVAPYAETHMKEIFLIAAIAYMVIYTLMCLKIKEDEYPPPPENIDKGTGILAAFKTFGAECFGHRLYWLFYITCALWMISLVTNTFLVFFFRAAGATTEQYFRVSAIGQWLTVPFLLAGGWVVDRKHPLRIQIVALAGLMCVTPLNLVFLFHDFAPGVGYWVVTSLFLLSFPLQGLYAASEIPMFMRMLPKSRYGQFSSANALVCALAYTIGGYVAGYFIDMAEKMLGSHEKAYLLIPAWATLFQILSMISLLLLFRAWKRAGGDHNYIPPGFPVDDKVM